MESNVKNNSFIDGLNLRKDWRYRRGNQKPYIEGQTIQWPKVTGQRGNQKPYIEGQTIQWPKVTAQSGNQKPYIEGQTIQWPKVKGQRDKQWLTKHYSKLKIEQQEPT
jgi:hypothetical protein